MTHLVFMDDPSPDSGFSTTGLVQKPVLMKFCILRMVLTELCT